MEQTTSRMAEILALTEKRAAERREKIAEIRKRVDGWCLSQGFELSPQDLDDVAALTYRREALVGLMAKATPLGERWNEIPKEIVECECEIARIDSRLV
jgi:hypothetical protein